MPPNWILDVNLLGLINKANANYANSKTSFSIIFFLSVKYCADYQEPGPLQWLLIKIYSY